ncbi:hypothetical protein HDU99_003446, partial [Rhizoclosmatium hyalinum]
MSSKQQQQPQQPHTRTRTRGGGGGSRKTDKEKEVRSPEFKVVVRRLPPNLPSDVFDQTLAQWAHLVTWSKYFAGKISKNTTAKPHTLSRAYLSFTSLDHLAEFAQAYNGWLFKEEKSGTEYRASVEMAPFQKVPRRKPRVDYRVNTLETDPEYLEFIESLKQDPKEAAVAAAAAAAAQAAEAISPTHLADQPKSTPLLDDLRAKKAAVREAQERKKEAVLKARKAAQEAAFAAKQLKGKGGRKSKSAATAVDGVLGQVAAARSGQSSASSATRPPRGGAKDNRPDISSGRAVPITSSTGGAPSVPPSEKKE